MRRRSHFAASRTSAVHALCEIQKMQAASIGFRRLARGRATLVSPRMHEVILMRTDRKFHTQGNILPFFQESFTCVGDLGVCCRRRCLGIGKRLRDQRQRARRVRGSAQGRENVLHPPRHPCSMTSSEAGVEFRRQPCLAQCFTNDHRDCHRDVKRAHARLHWNGKPCVGGPVHLLGSARQLAAKQ